MNRSNYFGATHLNDIYFNNCMPHLSHNFNSSAYCQAFRPLDHCNRSMTCDSFLKIGATPLHRMVVANRRKPVIETRPRRMGIPVICVIVNLHHCNHGMMRCTISIIGDSKYNAPLSISEDPTPKICSLNYCRSWIRRMSHCVQGNMMIAQSR